MKLTDIKEMLDDLPLNIDLCFEIYGEVKPINEISMQETPEGTLALIFRTNKEPF